MLTKLIFVETAIRALLFMVLSFFINLAVYGAQFFWLYEPIKCKPYPFFKIFLSLAFIIPATIIVFIDYKKIYIFIKMKPNNSSAFISKKRHGFRFALRKTKIFLSRFFLFSFFSIMLALSSFYPAGYLGDWVVKIFHRENELRQIMKFIAPCGNLWDTLGIFLTVGVIGPISEEIVFRGVIQKDLIRFAFTKGYVFFILIFQALLFALAHLNLTQFFPALFAGFILGYIFFITKSIFYSIIFHIVYNLIYILLLLDWINIPYLNHNIDMSFTTLPVLVVILSLVLVYFFGFFLWYFRNGIKQIINFR